MMIYDIHVFTFERSTPVRALTVTGSSASRRFTSPVTRLPSPLRITISLVLPKGAATFPAIWKTSHWLVNLFDPTLNKVCVSEIIILIIFYIIPVHFHSACSSLSHTS